MNNKQISSLKSDMNEYMVDQMSQKRHKFTSFNGYSASVTPSELQELQANGMVENILPVGKKHVLLNEVDYLMNATNTWGVQSNGVNLTGKGQSVCVIDTGANYSHPDLGGCMGPGCKIIAGWNVLTNTTDITDNHGHGTHVAGTVAAHGTYNGVAPEANLVIIKVSDDGSLWDDDVIAGIQWCISNF